MTIREMINTMIKLSAASPLGDDTVVAVCLLDSELPYSNAECVRLETDSAGALVVIDTDVHGL